MLPAVYARCGSRATGTGPLATGLEWIPLPKRAHTVLKNLKATSQNSHNLSTFFKFIRCTFNKTLLL
jgi:hypothetical protein